MSCTVGMAVLDVIENEKLQENASKVGAYLLSGLNKLKSKYSIVGDVRGLGLFIGVELVLNLETLEPAPEQATYIIESPGAVSKKEIDIAQRSEPEISGDIGYPTTTAGATRAGEGDIAGVNMTHIALIAAATLIGYGLVSKPKTKTSNRRKKQK